MRRGVINFTNSVFFNNSSTPYGDIPTSINNNFDTNQDFSVTFWFKMAKNQPKNSTSNTLVEKWSQVNGFPFTFKYQNAGNQLQFTRYDGTFQPTISSNQKYLNDNEWHHAAGTKVGSILTLYIDGLSTNGGSTTDTTSATTQNTSDLFLGRRGTVTTANYIGFLAHLHIYNRGLSSNEILNIYLTGNTQSGLVGFYKLDEGSGTTLIDSSGNGNNGTLNGAGAIYTTDVPMKSRTQVT